MITNTFCHIPGIGLKKEQRLWDSGLDTWRMTRHVVKTALVELKPRLMVINLLFVVVAHYTILKARLRGPKILATAREA